MALFGIVCVLVIVYPYLIYPPLLWLVRRLRGGLQAPVGVTHTPSVSVIVPVHNGAAHISRKLANLRAQIRYGETMHIVVVSDGSTDGTEERVRAADFDNVTLVQTGTRVGKTVAENWALETVDSDIIVFTDATTEFAPGTVQRLVERFADPRVGCASTEDRIVAAGGQGVQEGLYVRFEMWLRRIESDLGLLSGMSGSGYACRHELAERIPAALTRDMHVPLRARERGLLSVSVPDAQCYIAAGGTPRAELRRKLRTFTNGIDTMAAMQHLLLPWRSGLFAFALWSHKVIRWLGALGMLGLLVASVALAPASPLWLVLLVVQLAGYVNVLLHWVFDRSPMGGPVETLSFFALTNLAAALAWAAHFRGQSFVTWGPTQR